MFDSNKELNIIIPIPPRTKKNSLRIINVKGKPIIIPSELYKKYEKECRPFIPKIYPPINYPINMKCIYYMPTRRKVDLNNLLEASTDMLVFYKVLEDDNSKIVVSHDGSRVFYDKENPRAEIYIKRVEENVWGYIYRFC